MKACVDAAVAMRAIQPSELERVIVDTTVQEKAIAHPTDSRLLEVARHQVVKAANAAGIGLKQTFAAEGKMLRRRADGYAHARQLKRLKRVVRRQRTIVQRLLREVERKLADATPSPAVARLRDVMVRAGRIADQQPKDKNKRYAMRAPEVECISKGKARRPYEFGVKASIAVTHRSGLVVGARTFPGNPYDGHTLSAQLEQTAILLEDTGRAPQQAIVDLGYRGVDADNPGVEIIHRGRYKSMTRQQRRWLKRRQAVEPAIGRLKSELDGSVSALTGGKFANGAVTAAFSRAFNDEVHRRQVVRHFNKPSTLHRANAEAAEASGGFPEGDIVYVGHGSSLWVKDETGATPWNM